MKDVKDFLERKYNDYIASANAKHYIDRKYTVNILTDDELCECIENSPDWEFCEMYGLLDELSIRTNINFIVNEEFEENLVYSAMEQLGCN